MKWFSDVVPTLSMMVLVAVPLAVAFGCPSWDPLVHNPRSDDYPCGTRGVVCSTTPLSCCWQGETCCKDMCCPTEDMWAASIDAGGGRQWTP